MFPASKSHPRIAFVTSECLQGLAMVQSSVTGERTIRDLVNFSGVRVVLVQNLLMLVDKGGQRST